MKASMLSKVIGLFALLLILVIFTSVPTFAVPPTISDTWQLVDNMSTEGLYQVRAKITIGAVPDPGDTNAYIDASIDGESLGQIEMQYNPFDEDWGWWGYIDPPTTLAPGTAVAYRIMAQNKGTGEWSYDPPIPGLYHFVVVQPPAWRIIKNVEGLCQFNFENIYWLRKTNSWCVPTATASCLRWLQVPGLPQGRYSLVKKLAVKMDTDSLRTSPPPPGNPGSGTACGAEVKGIHNYLTSLGQRANYVIKVWDDTSHIGYGKANQRFRRNPGFLDYKRELRDCEDVLLIIRYIEPDPVCYSTMEDGGHMVTGMGWSKDGTSTSCVMDPACGIKKQPIKWLSIVSGPDCVADTAANPNTDDVQLVQVGQPTPSPTAAVIGPGPNGTVETKPQGDDVCLVNYNGIQAVAGAMVSISPKPAP